MFIFEEPSYRSTIRVFQQFMWGNRGMFLASGLGLAAAYALMDLLPAQLRQLFAQSLLGAVLMTAVLLAVFARRTLSSLSRKPLYVGMLQLLVFVVLVLPALSAKAAGDPNCTLATACGLAKYGPAAGARTLEQPQGYKQVYKSIYNIGKSADGKYNVYNIKGELNEPNYTVGNLMFSDSDLIRLLPAVDKADVGKTVQCGSICKNAAGQVVGVNPAYKAIMTGKKK